MGRFVQEDDYREGGLNLYAYCNNNPIIWSDPSGYKHEMKGSVIRDGEAIFTANYVSGSEPEKGYIAPSGYDSTAHTEQKFISQVNPELQAGDQLLMEGSLDPCNGCKKVIKDTVIDEAVTAKYTASGKDKTFIYDPISDGDYVVKQTVLDSDGNIISEHKYKRDEDGKYTGEKCN